MELMTIEQAHGKDAAYFGDRPDWYVAIVTHRDAETLTRANFDEAVDRMERFANSDDWAVEESGHWAVGWVRFLVVRPDTTAHAEAIAIANELEQYPVLDDDRFSEYEQEYGREIWEECFTMRDRIQELARHEESIFAARAPFHELYERAESTYYAVCQE